MIERADSDDFLGWAPDLGLWDSAPALPTPAPPRQPATAAPAPIAQDRAPVRRPGVTARQPPPAPTPGSATPRARPPRVQVSKLRVPALIAAAVMLVLTFFTALTMATSGPQSSPVMLGVFGVATALLGRVAWGLRDR